MGVDAEGKASRRRREPPGFGLGRRTLCVGPTAEKIFDCLITPARVSGGSGAGEVAGLVCK